MQNHTKVYLKHFDVGEQDLIACEVCQKQGRVDGEGFDIHHLDGRGNDKDVIENLMCTCRRCHKKIHEGLFNKAELKLMHRYFLSGYPKKFRK
jgi:hypothetical protein